MRTLPFNKGWQLNPSMLLGKRALTDPCLWFHGGESTVLV
jgi:hypothetical protein